MFEHRDVAYERARGRLVAKLLLAVVIVILGIPLLFFLASFTIREFTDPGALTELGIFVGIFAVLNSIALLPTAVNIWSLSRANPQTLPHFLLETIGALVGAALGILPLYIYASINHFAVILILGGGSIFTGFIGWGLGVMIANWLGKSKPVIEKDLTKLLL